MKDIFNDKVLDIPEESLERIRCVLKSYGFSTQPPYKPNDWVLVKDERYGWLIVSVLPEEDKSEYEMELNLQEEAGTLPPEDRLWCHIQNAGVYGEDKIFGMYQWGFTEKWAHRPIEVEIADLSVAILFSDSFEYRTDLQGDIMRKGGRTYDVGSFIGLEVFHKDDEWEEGGEDLPVMTQHHEREGLRYDESSRKVIDSYEPKELSYDWRDFYISKP